MSETTELSLQTNLAALDKLCRQKKRSLPRIMATLAALKADLWEDCEVPDAVLLSMSPHLRRAVLRGYVIAVAQLLQP